MPQTAKKPAKEKKSHTPVRELGAKDLLGSVQDVHKDQYVEYLVEANILSKIVGGTPKRLETTFAMIDSRTKAGKLTEEEAEAIKENVVKRYQEMHKKTAAANGEEAETADPEAISAAATALEANWNTFWFDANGLYLETRTIKAAIRSSLSVLNVFTENRTARKRVGHNDGSYIESTGPYLDRIYLMRHGNYITEPDEYEDRVVLLRTAKGPISALKRIDVVWGEEMNKDVEGEPYECRLTWKYKVLKSCTISEEDVVKGLALLQDRGLGAMTSQGFGRFKLSRFERL